MPLRFYIREQTDSGRVALFPGAYNPPTVAHVAIASAALAWADEVVWVLPGAFPHKAFEHTGFEDRAAMLRKVVASDPQFSFASSGAGLYADIGDEARAYYGGGPEIAILCGKDAAHRAATWKYDSPGFYEAMSAKYRLLVAARRGEYLPEPAHRERVMPLEMPGNFDEVSSSEVRERLRIGGDWRSLVPPELWDDVSRLYCQPPPSAR